MIYQTNKHFDIEPIIAQVKALNMEGRSLALNYTEGNLLSGHYLIKPEFVNTPLGNVLEALGDIGEARLLRLASQDVYTAHTDPDDRFHLNIISNEHCYLLDLETRTMHTIPVDGYVYSMDTSIVHSAINLGSTERIHLNVRVRMPRYTVGGYRVSFTGGDFDWKYKLYYKLMGYLNKAVLDGTVTGFDKVTDREFLFNCDETVLDIIKQLTEGFTMEVTNDTSS